MPLFKSRAAAEEDGDVLYAPGSKDAIIGYIQAHGGSAQTERIIDYMAEMYGISEGVTRTHLSQLTKAGDVQSAAMDMPRGSGGAGEAYLHDGRGTRGHRYTVPSDEYTGEEFL